MLSQYEVLRGQQSVLRAACVSCSILCAACCVVYATTLLGSRHTRLESSTKHASVRENARAQQPTEQAERIANTQACCRRSPISAVVLGDGRTKILARWGVSRGRRGGSR